MQSEVYLVLCKIHPVSGQPVPTVSYLFNDTDLSETLYPHFQKSCLEVMGEGDFCVLEVDTSLFLNPNDASCLEDVYAPFVNSGFEEGLLPLVRDTEYIDLADKIEKFLIDNGL